jgi:hypothetical protein
LEIKDADFKAMQTKIKDLEKDIKKLKDIEDIGRLQKAYGYYLEHWMYDEIIDLFADEPDTTLNIMYGIFYGKEGIRRYFTGMLDMTQRTDFVHLLMQLAGIVDISDDGKSAEGRWSGFGIVAMPRKDAVTQLLTGGIYTVEYIKKDDKWQIHKLIWNPLCNSRPGSWLNKTEKGSQAMSQDTSYVVNNPRIDKKRDLDTVYPSGYIVPFHYVHPVTGKPSSEAKRNAAREKKDK